jgi:hypothetical protein
MILIYLSILSLLLCETRNFIDGISVDNEFVNGRTMQFLTTLNVTLDSSSFADLKTLVLFIGYPRSAHSLVGSILDAHPNAVVSNELHLLARAHRLFTTASRLYGSIVSNSARHAAVGRSQAGFGYSIEGAWQGRWRAPLLSIGDKKGHGTTKHLHDDWQKATDILLWLQDITKLKLRFLHVVRNPFDNVATMIFRDHLKSAWLAQRNETNASVTPWHASFDAVVDTYLAACETNARALSWIASECGGRCGGAAALSVDGRALLARPAHVLAQLARHIDVPFDEQWARLAAASLYPAPFNSRDRIAWPQRVVARITDLLHRHALLAPLAAMCDDRPHHIITMN